MTLFLSQGGQNVTKTTHRTPLCTERGTMCKMFFFSKFSKTKIQKVLKNTCVILWSVGFKLKPNWSTKKTTETSKETVDQFDFVFLSFITQFILLGYFIWEIKKSSAIKNKDKLFCLRFLMLIFLLSLILSFRNIFNIIFNIIFNCFLAELFFISRNK